MYAPTLAETIEALGLAGAPVCCHASMRSFAEPVRAEALIEALVGEGTTLMVPTFTYHYEVPPPDQDRPERNGMRYDSPYRGSDPDAIFDPAENDLTRHEMGALPATVLAQSRRIRGNHALNSFTAIGPDAEALVSGQTPEDVYLPFRELLARGGKLLLCGTDATSLTFIHFAEQEAGRSLFVRWARRAGGEIGRTRVGGCSNGFGRLMPILEAIGTVAYCLGSKWIAIDADEALRALVAAIAENPRITHCGRAKCGRCDDAVLGGPV